MRCSPPSPGRAAGCTPTGRRPSRCGATTGFRCGSALVSTGFGYARARRVVQGEIVAAVLPQVRDIRRGGSCAVDLCSVAAGRMDAYYERGVNYWDWAAGGLIAAEAGARVGRAGRPATQPGADHRGRARPVPGAA